MSKRVMAYLSQHINCPRCVAAACLRSCCLRGDHCPRMPLSGLARLVSQTASPPGSEARVEESHSAIPTHTPHSARSSHPSTNRPIRRQSPLPITIEIEPAILTLL